MRIIAGIHGSRRLVVPKGEHTRPTLERTRESLFSMLQPYIPGAAVLDLFAGSGALGLEALSRSAAHAVFCDNSGEAIRAVRQNIKLLQLEERTAVIAQDYQKALHQLEEQEAVFDMIFVDPPYHLPAGPVLSSLAAHQTLSPEGIIILEQDRRSEVVIPESFTLLRSRTFRDTRIDLITYAQEDAHANGDIPGQL